MSKKNSLISFFERLKKTIKQSSKSSKSPSLHELKLQNIQKILHNRFRKENLLEEQKKQELEQNEIKQEQNTQPIYEYNNITFTFLSRFEYKGRKFVQVKTKTKNENENENENEITFASSISEFGFWRICMMIDDSVLQKGIIYTMSSFIVLEIQFFINENYIKIPERIGENISSNTNLRTYCCDTKLQILNTTLNDENRIYSIDSDRNDANRKYLSIGSISTTITNTLLSDKKLEFISINNYSYHSIYSTESISLYIKLTGKIFCVSLKTIGYTVTETETETETKPTKSRKSSRSSSSRSSSSRSSSSNTDLDTNNKEYNFKFYYMIYDLIIVDNKENKNIVNVMNYIIPIYLIPDTIIEARKLTQEQNEYGLYNYYSIFTYDSPQIMDFCKFFTYKKHLKTHLKTHIKKDEITEIDETYSFIGKHYNNIDVLKTIKFHSSVHFDLTHRQHILQNRYVKY